MKNLRTFVAVEISPEVKARANKLIERFRETGVKATFTKMENLHLTLKFLGDTPETLIPDVCRAVTRACANIAPFPLRFGCAGAFPHLDHPQTLWLGVLDGSPEITALQQAVEEQLFQLRFPRERRRFLPHLTLGRSRGGTPPQFAALREIIEQSAVFDGGVSIIEEVLVISSSLDRHSGPTYDVLSRTDLTDR